ncbi:hypothetical protein CISG_01362 [Coccidioides immitis RMSCC 3703]|uniref:Uncharacterized protein n=2 Tax=Coccidioides immitis TaxID=5501 RepID=A0A0J8QZZ3_COCIT|nr:hypothetical protein CISG_01362 [Coccidioides immitis RMSCC 3703]
MSGNECIRSKTNIDHRGNDIDILSTVRVSSWLDSTSRAEPKLGWTRLNLGPLPIAIPTWSSVGPKDELSSVNPPLHLEHDFQDAQDGGYNNVPTLFWVRIYLQAFVPAKGSCIIIIAAR